MDGMRGLLRETLGRSSEGHALKSKTGLLLRGRLRLRRNYGLGGVK